MIFLGPFQLRLFYDYKCQNKSDNRFDCPRKGHGTVLYSHSQAFPPSLWEEKGVQRNKCTLQRNKQTEGFFLKFSAAETCSTHEPPLLVHRNTCTAHQSPRTESYTLHVDFCVNKKKQRNTQFSMNIMVWIVVQRLSPFSLVRRNEELFCFQHKCLLGLKKHFLQQQGPDRFNGCSLNLALISRSSTSCKGMGLGTINLSPSAGSQLSMLPLLSQIQCTSDPAQEEHLFQQRPCSPGESEGNIP